jgi:L,D-peptidoglycan transpeptidase YkuD (ErfK/YbiS/YcfS/YnhG family)
LLFTLAAVLTLIACGSRPAPELEPARRVAWKAVRLVRPSAPQKAKYIERLIADAEVVTAAEAHAPWWRANEGRTEAAWLRVARAAAQATRAVRAQQGQARERYHGLLVATKDELARARAELREAGMGRRESAAITRALVGLSTAEKLAALGEHARASDKLIAARQSLAIIHSSWASVHARFSDKTLLRTWKRWVDETLQDSRERGEIAIVVNKLHRRLTLYYRGLKLASYPAELGANGLARKDHAGDRATPEGQYRVVALKQGKATKFYKALLINYPNDEDRARHAQGKARGVIPSRAGIGNLIEIHGDGGQGRDWTDGCIALTNEDMDRVFARVHQGTPVTIVGTYEQ